MTPSTFLGKKKKRREKAIKKCVVPKCITSTCIHSCTTPLFITLFSILEEQ